MNAITPTEPFMRPAIFDNAEGIAKVHVKSWRGAYVGQLPQQEFDRQSIPAPGCSGGPDCRVSRAMTDDLGGTRWCSP